MTKILSNHKIYKIAKISLLISRQETMGKVRIDMNESKSNDDHTKCVKPKLKH